jgi:uncharacterized FlaG/YvyC family protein
MSLYSTVPIASSSASSETTVRSNPASQQERALNQSVTAAVGIVNQSSFLGEGREVQRSVAPGTHTPVIKVVDTKTKEVITQWPPEYLLQLAADLTDKTRDSG